VFSKSYPSVPRLSGRGKLTAWKQAGRLLSPVISFSGVASGPVSLLTCKEKSMATKAGKSITKSEAYQAIAGATGLSRKQVASVFDELTKLIGDNLGKKGPGVFSLPGLVKLKVVHKPAVPARKGINPFTKEEMMFKAKPARKVVKAVPFKALKEMVK